MRAVVPVVVLFLSTAARADEPPRPAPYVRESLYLRAAFGVSPFWVRTTGGDRTIRASAPLSLTNDSYLGLGVPPYLALGLAYHGNVAGASTTDRGVTESTSIGMHLPGVFATFYPSAETSGFYIGTTLGWSFTTARVRADGPALVVTTGLDARVERRRSVSAGLRFVYAPFLTNDDVRMSAVSVGFFLAVGTR